MSNTILYYPTIEIENTRWIKNTLLYWDKISTIVPYKDYHMSENISILESYNAYEPIYPEDIFERNADGFLEKLERRLGEVPRRDSEEAFINESKMFYMHGMKIMEQYPEVKRLFETAPSVNGEWIRIGKRAATAYMKTLAEFAVSGNEKMVIGTDRASKVGCFSNGYGDDIEANAWFELIFNSSVPMPAEDVPLEVILEFKTKHRRELVDFQTEISCLRHNISCCTNNEDIKECWDYFSKETAAALVMAETSLKEYGINNIKGSLKTGLNSLVPTDILVESMFHMPEILNFLGENIDPQSIALGAAGAIVLNAISTGAKNVYGKYKMSKSNFAYIMHADKRGIYRKRR